jgi:hypothetical protein
MGRHDKLLAQLLGGRADANVGFEAICALVRRLGFQERRDRAGQHAISVNDQWRICFRFESGDAFDVEFCDYH